MTLGNPHTLGQDIASMANNSLVILSFVSTFGDPSASWAMLSPANKLAALVGSAVLSTALAPLLLDQPFVVGLWFSPVPPKLITDQGSHRGK